MRISKICVYGLFDRFNHELVFKPDERITIMLAPNGYGKTTILRVINGLFNFNVGQLERLPFKEVTVLFDDDSAFKVTRSPRPSNSEVRRRQFGLKLEYSISTGALEPFVPTPRIASRDDIGIPIGAIEDLIPSLDQTGPSEWRHLRTGEILDLGDVIAEFGPDLQLISGSEIEDIAEGPSWLQKIKKEIKVRLIDVERLTNSPVPRATPSKYSRVQAMRLTERTVRRYSDELAKRIQQTLTEYATLSQSLDRSFPARLVEGPTTPRLTLDELRRELAEVEEKRSQIVDAGLLAQEHEGLSVPSLDSVDDSRRSVLAVYAQDARIKLSVFDDLYARVNAFIRIANTRLLYKRVMFSSDGLNVVTPDGSKLNLEMLSSGEQHEIVLLYDLLFGVAENSLIMIDEPELSLHVDWQREILNDLEEMADLSNFHVLLATHSPQIIGDRWDLTVELKGPDE